MKVYIVEICYNVANRNLEHLRWQSQTQMGRVATAHSTFDKALARIRDEYEIDAIIRGVDSLDSHVVVSSPSNRGMPTVFRISGVDVDKEETE